MLKRLTAHQESLNLEMMEMNGKFDEELKRMQENQSNMMFEMELQFRKIFDRQVSV